MNKDKLTALAQAVRNDLDFDMRRFDTCIQGVGFRLIGILPKNFPGYEEFSLAFGVSYEKTKDLILIPFESKVGQDSITREMAAKAIERLRDTGKVEYRMGDA